MLIALAAIGRLKSGPERELVQRYLERARASGRALGLSGFEVSEYAEARSRSDAERQREEAQLLLKNRAPGGLLVALDEKGKSLSSETFADWIGRERDRGTAAIHFVLGGADGLAPEVRKDADLVLSFSPLTWPHQLARILLAEQLYRATTILSGHPYHRGQ